jgi:hypothetical protein
MGIGPNPWTGRFNGVTGKKVLQLCGRRDLDSSQRKAVLIKRMPSLLKLKRNEEIESTGDEEENREVQICYLHSASTVLRG